MRSISLQTTTNIIKVMIAALVFSLLFVNSTRVVGATTLESSSFAGFCPEGSQLAGRRWNGTTYVGFGNGFNRLTVVAPSTVPITVTKPFSPDGTGTVYVQTVQIATKPFTTITKGVVIGNSIGVSELTPQGYQQLIVGLSSNQRDIRAIAVCIGLGGVGEDEQPEDGWFPIPVSALY
jgi:hypothetical protein